MVQPYTFAVVHRALIPGLLAVAVAASAHGQNTLDSNITRNATSRQGTTLDRNLRRGSSGVNESRRSGYSKDECDYRNLVVTGGVAGGSQFRGNVGYTAPTDFRGGSTAFLNPGASSGSSRVGSIEGFLAGSALSNPAFINSARAQDRFLLANGLGQFQWRPYLTPDPVELSRVPDWRRVDSQVRLDDVVGTQSLAGYRSGAQQWRQLAYGADDRNRPSYATFFHPVRGATTVGAENRPDFFAPSPYEAAQVRQDIDRGMVPFERAVTAFDQPYRRRLDEAERSGQPVSKDYRTLIERLKGRAAEDAKQRRERDKTPPAASGDDAADLLESIREQLRSGESESVGKDKPEDAAKPSTDGSAVRGPRPLTPEETALILKHGMTMKTIDAETGQRVDELLRMAASQMKRGDYFLAEDSARTAAALVLDHPTALAVKANAQIGAGLLRSAGLTLHDLFISSPEMIDVKFDASLLPDAARLRAVLARAKDEAPRQADAFDLGLVQAYIGFQLGDAEATAAGLGAMDQAGTNPTLSKVLRGVWLAPR
jgi:integrase